MFGKQANPRTPLRVFHIGNSITDTLRYTAFQQAVKQKGKTYIYGRHVIPGAPISWLWEHPNDGFFEEPYGRYPNALKNHTWDVLTLQPSDRHLTGADGDLAMSRKFIDLALPKSPNAQIYIYSRWPRREKDGSLNYAKRWSAKYTGGWDGTNESRDYYQQVTDSLRREYGKSRVHLVPVGDTLLALDKKLPGGAKSLYEDGVHFGDKGSYVVGCTFYASLFGDDPKGFSSEAYKVTDKAFAKQVQETAWAVVRANPRA